MWMVLPMLPVLDLRAFLSGQLIHDRYLYLPSFGFAMLVALALRHLRLGPARVWGQPAVQLGMMGIIVLAMCVMVVKATACYADQDTFITYINLTSPQGRIANMDMASLLGNHGHVDEAIQIYKRLLPANPDSWNINFNLGYGYYLSGNLPDADRYLTRATQIDPNLPEGPFYLGNYSETSRKPFGRAFGIPVRVGD
jgi:protein O-mannosyl-transferase